MKKTIIYSEVIRTFKFEDGKLFRLCQKTNRYGKKGEWGEVNLESNTAGGYCVVGWGRKVYKAHRIIYSLAHKCDVDPTLDIDHINGIRDDNRPNNLRLSTSRENNQNRLAHREGRLVGCYWDKQHKKWQARIRIGKKKVFLGYYLTAEEAHEVYLVALQSLKLTV